MRVALIQMTSSDAPEENARYVFDAVTRAAADGAEFIATPEVCNCVSLSRRRQHEVLREEGEDATLAAMREAAARAGVWALAGSLALKVAEDRRFVNRSILIGPDGGIAARYDKVHMFDAAPGPGETYRESAGYRPGGRAVLAAAPFGGLGLTICYDLRFPPLFLRLARAGAKVITVPSAFTRPTGAAHWEVLLRARAIETGCYILAPAQCGRHPAHEGRSRETWGHSLIVSPWGEVLAEGGETPGIAAATLDLGAVADARRRTPSLTGERVVTGP